MLVTRRDQRVCPQLYNSHLPILYTFNFVLNKREQYGFQNNNRTQGFFPFYFFVLFLQFLLSFFLILLCFFRSLNLKGASLKMEKSFVMMLFQMAIRQLKCWKNLPSASLKRQSAFVICDLCVTRCVTGVTQRTCGKLRKQKDLLKKLLIAILLCCRLKLQF